MGAALKSRRVASLAHMGRDGSEAIGEMTTSLAAAVPLVDVDGRVWAILAIQELPFYAFTPENLSLFALMAGALADTLEFGATVKSYDPRSTQRFEQRVRRCLVDARRHGVPASLVVFSVSNAARASELLPRVLEERRGIDEACLALAPDGGLRLFVLLPLTDGKGAESYLKRLDKAVQTKLRVSLSERGIRLLQAVDLQDSASDTALTQLKLLAKPKQTRALGMRSFLVGFVVLAAAVVQLEAVILGVGAVEVPNTAVGLYLLGALGGAAALVFAVTPQGRRPRFPDAMLDRGVRHLLPGVRAARAGRHAGRARPQPDRAQAGGAARDRCPPACPATPSTPSSTGATALARSRGSCATAPIRRAACGWCWPAAACPSGRRCTSCAWPCATRSTTCACWPTPSSSARSATSRPRSRSCSAPRAARGSSARACRRPPTAAWPSCTGSWSTAASSRASCWPSRSIRCSGTPRRSGGTRTAARAWRCWPGGRC